MGSPPMKRDPAVFQSTLWSVVLQARESTDSGRRAALDRLCGIYWPPLYAYLRRKGFGAEDAEDHIQGFFGYFLGKELMANADPARGRFRNYLLAVLRNYVGNELQYEGRRKRGGDAPVISLDRTRIEAEISAGPPGPETPEAAYHRAWIISVLDQAYQKLKHDLAVRHGPELAALIGAHLGSSPERLSYEDLSRRSGKPVTTITNLLHAARRSLRQHIRSVLLETVENESEVDDEIRELFKSP